MRLLSHIYKDAGVRGTFNVEVMQQVTFRKFQSTHAELAELADQWDEVVLETYRAGQDMQLHVHPQWSDCSYQDGKWTLTGDWSILDYPRDHAKRLLETSKAYLEALIKRVDPSYRCVSFRSGSWCIAPSPHILEILVELGIILDVSIVGGVKYDTNRIQLDYSRCEESFLPFYPQPHDARIVSSDVQSIICTPTHHFFRPSYLRIASDVNRLRSRLKRAMSRFGPPNLSAQSSDPKDGNDSEWAPKPKTSLKKLRWLLTRYFTPIHLISDLAQLDYEAMLAMFRDIRNRALRTGLSDVPIVIENHTKDIRDFSDIARFLARISREKDVRFITLSELARDLHSGKFPVRKAV